MSVRAEPSRHICFRMLCEVILDGQFSNQVTQNLLSGASLTPAEKSFATALFYGTITHKYTLDYYLKKNLRKKFDTLESNVHILLLMGAWQLIYSTSVPSFAAVNETVRLAKLYTNEGGVRLVNAVLRSLSQDKDSGAIDPDKEKFDVKYSLNRELSGSLIHWYGKERAASLAASFFGTPHITARVNRLKTDPERLVLLLEKEGVNATGDRLCPDALRLELNGKSIHDLKAFQQGYFMIQDEAAMLASWLFQAKPGDSILDVCSAPGGKTCHLAEQMHDKGHILALDMSESRIELVEQNQKRLGITCIDTGVLNAEKLIETIGEQIQTYDGVLCDVPCSGLGLLLRKPDIRHTMTYEKIQSLIETQHQILSQSSAFVRKGGTLLYATCTINPHENQLQVERFLTENEDFEVYPFDSILPENVAKASSEHAIQAKIGQLILLPDQDKCDGFFVARFRRKA